MKRLEITGLDGIKIACCLIDVKGDNYLITFRLPLILSVVQISLTELSQEENERMEEHARNNSSPKVS